MIDSIIDKDFARGEMTETLSPVKDTAVFTHVESQTLYWVQDCERTGQYKVLEQYDLRRHYNEK